MAQKEKAMSKEIAEKTKKLSEEMAEPIFPANTIAVIVGLNSRILESLFTEPIMVLGMKSLTS